MSQLPIPEDWDEQTDGYAFVWLCVPNSTMWRSIVRGKIYELTRGRNWDGDTGTITDAQAIAWEIMESLCMANCDDILTALNNIATNTNVTELTKAVRELTAVVASQAVDLTLPIADNLDYSALGIDKRLADLLAQIGNHPP